MILLVDDKPENLFSLKSVLSRHDFKVDIAGSGEEALKKILNTVYSLIILDVQMPEMDGFEVAEAISGYSKARETPIIFLSAASKEKKFITKGYNSGGIDYITKPVDPDILLLKVKNLYRMSEQRQELQAIRQVLENEIEKRKSAQNELEQRIQELHSVMECLPQIAFKLNSAGNVEYANEHWYRYSDQLEIFPETHPEDGHTYHLFEEALSAGLDFSAEVRLRERCNDHYRYYLFRVIAVKQSQSVLNWVGTYTDIHQQKVANELLEEEVLRRTEDLSKKNEELEMSNHELQQFAWVASHDLQEPLRKIQTYNSIIREKYVDNNAEAQSYLDRSIKASDRMTKLINNLLDYARLSAHVSFQPTPLDIIVEEIVSDLEVNIQEKKAVISKSPLPVIDAIPTQIRQVFQNLVSNSLKFSMMGNPPHISIAAELVKEKSVESATDPAGGFCRITIQDNGIGFNEKFLDRIFVIFQRLELGGTYEGTGIGLAITKKIIDKHNGIITARSKENEGATFIMVLPVYQNQN